MLSAELDAMKAFRKHPATYDDVLAAPEGLRAELLDGELVASPRPTADHIRAAGMLDRLLGPFDRKGGGGAGGWWILVDPEVHLGSDVLVPDLAGWRRDRLPALPEGVAFTVRPDWVCEVLSPGTASHDRVRKMRTYARAGVPHAWLIDPRERTLEVFRLQGDTLVNFARFEGTERVRAEPFEALDLELAALWDTGR